MNNLEEKEMKILTQEEFDKITKDENYHYSIIKYCVIKDIIISGDNFTTKTSISFVNCRIESISLTPVVENLFASSILFNGCDIVDYEKVECIDEYKIIDCTFEKPVPITCPENGEFIGYKKCVYRNKKKDRYGYCVVKLLIPEDAKRSSAFGRKCRCSKAKVLGIFSLEGDELSQIRKGNSTRNLKVIYEIGKTVYPDSFDDNRYDECSNGIHFFMTFEEARDYGF